MNQHDIPKPVLQALVLADHVYVDAGTEKKIIAGTFNTIFSAEFPMVFQGTTWAYICLTEVSVPTTVTLAFTQLRTNSVLLESPQIPVQADTPLSTVEVVVQVPPFPLPEPGAYAFELYASGTLLGALRILVREITNEHS